MRAEFACRQTYIPNYCISYEGFYVTSIIPQDGWAHPFPNMESWNVDCQGGRPRAHEVGWAKNVRIGQQLCINCPLFLSSSSPSPSPTHSHSPQRGQPYNYVLPLAPITPSFRQNLERARTSHSHGWTCRM